MIGSGFLVQRSMGDKTIYFGIRIPYGYEKNEEIIKICKNYKKDLLISYGIFFIIIMAMIFLINEEYQSILILINVLVGDGIIQWCYYKAYKTTKKIKEKNGWKKLLEDKSIVVDLKFRKKSKSNKTLAIYIVCTIISIIDLFMIIEYKVTDMYYIAIIQFLTVITGIVLYNTVLKAKQNLNGGPIDIIKDKAILKRKSINNVIALSVLVVSIINTMIILSYANIINEKVLTSVLIIVVLMPLVFIGLSLREINNTKNLNYGEVLTENSVIINRDDDDLYIGGMYYYNPMDTSVMVESRTGMGLTFNFAKTSSKIIMTLLISFIVFVFIGVFWLSYNTKRLEVEMNKNQIEISGGGIYSDTINYKAVKEVSVEKSPKCLIRTNGTAIGDIKMGTFKTEEYGKVRLYILNDENEVIKIKYKDNKYIFINFEEDNKTKKLYENINKCLE